jgi:hypothetical protein
MQYKKIPKKKETVNIQIVREKPELPELPEDTKQQVESLEQGEIVEPAVEIVDLRKHMEIDRALVMKRLQEKNVITVVQPIAKSTRIRYGDEIVNIPKELPRKTSVAIVIEPIAEEEEVEKTKEEETTEEESEEAEPVEEEPTEEEAPEAEPVEEEPAEEPLEKPKAKKTKKAVKAPKEPSDEPTTEEPLEKTKEPKAKRTKKGKELAEQEKAEKLTKTNLLTRLPKPTKIVMKASPYYMTNRKLYIQKIRELFNPYSAEIEKMSENITCSSEVENVDFKLLTHQKIVRDYLNLYSPYRGLLLYHGLGSGKTCTSIAIAEGMKSEKQIVLMTPASLKTNFFAELKKCGDHLYRKNQFWEFIGIAGQPGNIDLLSTSLNIPKTFIEKNKGAWLVDVKKPSNFATLSSSDQESIDAQLDVMIRGKYQDINYNGLNANIMKTLTENGTKNPFDNKVVIIDEAHNLVSRIVNKIKKPASINYKLYDYLMKAQNARIVLLSGTPIINYPNEIAILFNVLRGAIKTWTIPVATKTEQKINREIIMEMFSKNDITQYDYVEYADNKVTITRNPFGFVNTSKKEKKGGNDGEPNDMMDMYLSGGGKSKSHTKKSHQKHPSKKNTTKKSNTLVPYVIKDGVIIINKQPEQEITEEESVDYYNRTQLDQDFHKGGADEFEKYTGVKLDETGNITDEQFITQIKKILRNNNVEVIDGLIKIEYNKPLPDNAESFLNTFIDTTEKTMKNENVFKRRILGLTSYFRSAQEQLLPSFVMNGDSIYHIETIEMSDHQFGEYVKIRKTEIEEEKRSKQKKQKQARAEEAGKNDDVFTMSSTYRIFSRACCNFAFPAGLSRPLPDQKERKEDEEDDENESETIDAVSVTDEDTVATEKEQVKYAERIQAALSTLSSDKYLSSEKLMESSPKFVKILENLQNPENAGLHLLYSQFRTIEGIGILKLILEANGFAEFKMTYTNGTWDIENDEASADKPKFVLYTGTETPEEKEIIRNIYNGNWEIIPKVISDKLKKKASNNKNGEIIKIFMITSSGAEGINLKNTRFVHIVEPYWHNVRLEQVIGRARRICSHQDLPLELRTVKVFLYISVFSETQKTDKQNIEIMIHDLSRIPDANGKQQSVSTDESLFEIANIKTDINQHILKSIKESAIDCTLYKNAENLVCYGVNQGKIKTNQFSSYPTLEMDLGERDDLNVKVTKIKLTETKPINGIVYAIDKKTGELYDLEKYKIGQLVKVGNIIKKGQKVEVILTKN